MPPQIACLGGYMITLVAFLRCAFSNVSSNGCVNGCIITLVAFVWLFFTVGFQMCSQSAGIKGCVCLIFLHCVFSNVSSKRLHKRMDNHTGCIWKHTVEKRLTSSTSAVCLCILSDIPFENTFGNPQRRKIKEMQPVRLCMLCTLSLCSKTMGSPFRVKALLHVLHLKGFSPVWVLMWCCKFPEEAQVKLRWLHLNGHFS